jgi:O-methyltransferase
MEFEVLVPRLSPGGLLIVDDYCAWQGARQATDEFLATQGTNFFIQHIGKGDDGGRHGVCFAIWKKR